MSKSLKVGFFVMAGLLLMGAIIWVIGDNQQTWARKRVYTTSFLDVAGLKPGAPVRLGGVDIGNVVGVSHSADIADSRIVVQIAVARRESPRIRKATVARIVNKGLLGDKMIELSVPPETSPELDPQTPIQGEEPVDFGKYLTKFEDIADKTERAVTNLERASGTLADPQLAEDLKGTMHSLRIVLDGVATGDGAAHKLLFDPETGRRLDRTLGNLDSATANLAGALADARDVTTHMKTGPGLAHALVYDGEMSASAAGALKEVHEDLAAVRGGNGLLHALVYGDSEGQRLMGNVNAMSDDLRKIVADLRAGKGTLGAFLVDPSVYEDVRSIVGNVDRNEVLRALVRYSIKADEKTAAPVPAPK